MLRRLRSLLRPHTSGKIKLPPPNSVVAVPQWPGTQELKHNMRNLSSFEAMLTNERIGVMVLGYCTAKSLVLLLRTNHSVNTLIAVYIKRAYDIHRVLRQYFTDPLSFRYLQAYTGTVISGSTALQFFDRSFYPESDLDIYAPKAWGNEVGRFLLRAGYAFVPHRSQHPNFDTAVFARRVVSATAVYGNFKGIAGVFNFVKTAPDGRTLKIQLIVAVRSPIEVILRYHSTAVMNIISFDRAYCLFPRATLDERLSLVCTSRQDDVIDAVYHKYAERGWSMIWSVDDIERVTPDPALRVNQCRWINDRYAWSIDLLLPPGFRESLRPLNPRTKALGRDPVSITSWGQSIAEDQRTCEMMFVQPQAINIFYKYVFAGYAVVRRRPVNSLFEITSLHNAGCHSNPLYSRHYADVHFMELCEEYYRVIF